MDTHKIVRVDKTSHARKPKILFWDIETSPILGWTWQAYDTNVIKVEKDINIISVAWRWNHETKTHVAALPDFPGYKPGKVDDKKLVGKVWDLLNEADVVIAQNGDKFDTRIVQARMLAHEIPPPSPFIAIDTLKIARRYFNMPMYKLDEMLRYTGLRGKIATGGKELWFDCMKGDPEAWKRMKEYNKNDVEIMPPLYDRMKGWHKTHPALTNFTRGTHACPVCMATKLERRGYLALASGHKQRYQCKACGKWSAGELERVEGKIIIR